MGPLHIVDAPRVVTGVRLPVPVPDSGRDEVDTPDAGGGPPVEEVAPGPVGRGDTGADGVHSWTVDGRPKGRTNQTIGPTNDGIGVLSGFGDHHKRPGYRTDICRPWFSSPTSTGPRNPDP